MTEIREHVTSADGTTICLRISGRGAPLLLVHGGMRSAEQWSPVRGRLDEGHLVVTMDRRGRGRSGDSPRHSLAAEFDDVRAVTEHLRDRAGMAVDVVGHSYGAVCALGAAARGAPVRGLVLYEPPGPQTVPAEWLAEVQALLAAGEPGRAVVSFLVDVIGLPRERVLALRDTPAAARAAPIAARTMRREAEALAQVDLAELARHVSGPVLLLLGSTSPVWAQAITHRLRQDLPQSDLVLLPGHGHDAVDADPRLVAEVVHRYLAEPTRDHRQRASSARRAAAGHRAGAARSLRAPARGVAPGAAPGVGQPADQ